MDCWHCGTELIWGGDHDLEEEFYGEDHAYDFVTNLSCPKCQAYVKYIIVKRVKNGFLERNCKRDW